MGRALVKANETWERDAFHFPDRVPALVESFNLEPAEEGTRIGFAAWSVPFESFRMTALDGWVYTRVEPFGGEPPPVLARAMDKFPFLAHLWRLDPRVRRRIMGFERFVIGRGFEQRISTWAETWEPEAHARITPFVQADVCTMSNEDLGEHLSRLREHMVWVWSIHANIHFTCFYIRGRFADLCKELLGLSAFEAYALLVAGDGSTEPPDRLTALADRVRDDPEVRQAVGAEDALERLAGTWFEDAFSALMQDDGHRTFAGFDITKVRWREDPGTVLALIRDRALSPLAPQATSAGARSEDLRDRLAPEDRAEFEHWLALARKAWPLNEVHEFLLTELPEGLVREAALEAGTRLSGEGILGSAEDVFLLHLDELCDALEGRAVPGDLETRRSALAAPATPAPKYIGPPPAEPPLHALPRGTAEALAILLEQLRQTQPSSAAEEVEGLVTGTPGSPGIAEGRAVVVSDPADVAALDEGDILVCRVTTPAWSVVFPRIGGLVTDEGGMLSHAAIVAREYGLPAVVGTRRATKAIRTGDIIRIDANDGNVSIIARGRSDGAAPITDERDAVAVSARLTPPTEDSSIAFVRSLATVGTGDVDSVGMKAARLGDLLQAGFSVPGGFVLTTSAYARSVASLGSDLLSGSPREVASEIRKRWLETDLPSEVREAILTSYRELGSPHVAVRSSSTSEDLDDASFAGQYDSVLDVKGDDEVLLAVTSCWISLWNERAVTYRTNKRHSATPTIAVVVQEMAPHEAAGVAFTRHPISGTNDIVVNAVSGLGEALVSGMQTPDQWIVSRAGSILERVAADPDAGVCLHDDHVREIADLAQQIEAHYGGTPQDVEWSAASGSFHVLQARPISALPTAL